MLYMCSWMVPAVIWKICLCGPILDFLRHKVSFLCFTEYIKQHIIYGQTATMDTSLETFLTKYSILLEDYNEERIYCGCWLFLKVSLLEDAAKFPLTTVLFPKHVKELHFSTSQCGEYGGAHDTLHVSAYAPNKT